MKKLKLFMAMIMAMVIFGGISGVNAVSGTVTNSTANHAVTLSRSVTGVTNKVNNTFTYTISAAAGNPSGASDVPTSETVAFSNVTPSSGTATATATLDFTGASFTTNGDYTYTITETGSSDSTTYPVDSTNKYTVKFSVRNVSATDFSSKVVTILLYVGTGGDATKKSDNTTFTFSKAAVFRTITIGKTVEGTMADADEYFAYAVTINGTSGDTYTVSGQSKSGAITSLTSGTAGTIYLKHGETATISGVKNGVTYSFNETAVAGYSTFINGSTVNDTSSGTLTVGATNSNTVKNVYSGSTLTGFFNRFTPYIIISAVGVLGVTLIVVRSVRYRKLEALEDAR